MYFVQYQLTINTLPIRELLIREEVEKHHDTMSATQYQNFVQDEHVAADHNNHSQDSDDTQDSELTISLMIISIAKKKIKLCLVIFSFPNSGRGYSSVMIMSFNG